jgi:hypothetical protein
MKVAIYSAREATVKSDASIARAAVTAQREVALYCVGDGW